MHHLQRTTKQTALVITPLGTRTYDDIVMSHAYAASVLPPHPMVNTRTRCSYTIASEGLCAATAKLHTVEPQNYLTLEAIAISTGSCNG